MYDYRNTFKLMLAKCPKHIICNPDSIQYYVNGIRSYESRILNASCGGFILNKQPSEAFRSLNDMAEVSRKDNQTWAG